MNRTAVPANPVTDQAEAVVDFWQQAGPTRWFAKDAAFDASFRERFEAAHFAAARQELMGWLDKPESALALILLLDQYPRNAFRGTGHMFATDGLALQCARLSLPYLEHLDPAMRNFLCLPFMHAENLALQEASVALYERHIASSIYWARLHHDIIARFGRFPHRNHLLGRITSVAEQAFLDEGGFAG